MIENQRRTWMFRVLFYRKENIIFEFNKEQIKIIVKNWRGRMGAEIT